MLGFNSLQAQTSAASTTAGTVGTANNPGSSGSWASVTNVQTENNVYATALITGSNKSSNYLDATNWGFQSTNAAAANYIPSNATINGIQVSIKRRKTLTGNVRDSKVILLKSSGEVGVSRASTVSWPTTSAFAAYGNEIDLWGASFTAADLTNSGFGVRIAARNKGKKDAQAEIDYIKITVFFNQTIYYSKNTGNLETLATWGTVSDGTGTAPLNFTRDGQLFILTNRATATLTGNLTISGLNSGFVIGNGAVATPTTLTIPSNYVLTASVNLKDNSSLTITNTTAPVLTSIGANTTVTYNASADQTIADAAYYNLSLSGSGKKLFTTNSAVATTIDNILSITGGVTADNRGNNVIVGGSIANSGYASGTGSYTYSITDANGTLSGNGIYDNLEVDASSSSNSTYSVTLSNSTTVKSTLYLNSGSISNSTNLTMNAGSFIKVEDGTLANALSSTGYDVTYLPSSNTTITAGGELAGTVKNLDVQVGSGATLTLNRNVSMTGNLAISSGTLDVSNSNYNLTVGGNLTNNGTLNLRSNTVTLNGNGVQTIDGSSAQTFNSLTVNNATGGSVQLNKPVTVNNTLTLTNGIVTTSSTNTLTTAANATISGGNSASYINGPLKMTVNSINSTKTFPVGKNGAYRPLSLSIEQNATTSTVYTAEAIAGAPTTRTYTTGIQNVSSVRYYTIGSSNAATLSSATINLSYNTDDQVLNPSVLRVAKSNGTQWANLGGSGSAANNGTISSTSFTSLGDFVLANINSIVLPLTWLGFDATKKVNAIELNWQTAQEVNTAAFVIEKSADGVSWSRIGTLASKNIAGTNTYTFTDAFPAAVNYYRIKQVDIDGQFAYSKTIRIVYSTTSTDIVVYPTIIRNGTINCVIKDQEVLKSGQISVAVYDLSGKLVYANKMKPLPLITFTCSNLAAGQYTVLIGNENNYQQAKVLVQ
ncbi:hypothetical protein SY85_09885 [Flavisolibacter tropicus]|uniref:Secretion system C-terminal sorting domain-containing protein n=1 Tax=Flavisolibacter tropicus TaxID=1492898 RepID=A0A172TVF2_9BACT|nr:hypothetical protein SY85_09885 [Flavisolibacter tropicus]